MTKKFPLLVSAALVASVLSTGALACGPEGSHRHMGQVMSVDREGGTFTIMDAQTASPITFSADKEILDGVTRARGGVMVDYSEDGGTLRAERIQF